MLRFNCAILLAIGCWPVAAAAQTLSGTPTLPKRPPGPISPLPAPSNPRSVAQGIAGSKVAALTVTYPAVQGDKMLLSSPAGAFQCVLPALPSTFLYRCTLAVPQGKTTTLEATWLVSAPIASNGTQVAGQQWGGSCAGTAGPTCTLVMSADRTVALYPFAAGGIPKPMGTTDDQ